MLISVSSKNDLITLEIVWQNDQMSLHLQHGIAKKLAEDLSKQCAIHEEKENHTKELGYLSLGDDLDTVQAIFGFETYEEVYFPNLKAYRYGNVVLVFDLKDHLIAVYSRGQILEVAENYILPVKIHSNYAC